MSRLIEFRAWDKACGKMLLPDNCNGWVMYGNGCSAVEGVWATSDLELMQYTGITDKNGVKIFEGDVLFWNNTRWVCNWSEKLSRYFYQTIDSFTGRDPSIRGEWGMMRDRLGLYTKVIGNIYQNPNLLESEQ